MLQSKHRPYLFPILRKKVFIKKQYHCSYYSKTIDAVHCQQNEMRWQVHKYGWLLNRKFPAWSNNCIKTTQYSKQYSWLLWFRNIKENTKRNWTGYLSMNRHFKMSNYFSNMLFTIQYQPCTKNNLIHFNHFHSVMSVIYYTKHQQLISNN